jgi:hypothetical protein
VKSDKARGSSCRKSEIGQLRDHIQWIQENRPVAQVAPIFVGPYLPPSRQANPGTEIVVIEIATLSELAQRLTAGLEDVCARATPITLMDSIQQVLAERGLLWPRVYEGLQKRRLRDLA